MILISSSLFNYDFDPFTAIQVEKAQLVIGSYGGVKVRGGLRYVNRRLRRSTCFLRIAAASTADVAIVMALHLALPHLPLVWIVVPIVALNVLLFGSAAAYSAFKVR